MYCELIESLRLCVKYNKANDALANAGEAANTIEKLQDALLLMVLQYCTTDNGLLYHSFMSAGEEAFAVLGVENGQQADSLWNKLSYEKPPRDMMEEN